MIFRVILQPNAKANLHEYYRRAAKHAPLTAARWMERFTKALEGLATMPERHPLAPEEEFLQIQLRQMLFGKKPNVYRVLFRVKNDEVHVLHIRRAAMDLASLADIYGDDPPADGV